MSIPDHLCLQSEQKWNDIPSHYQKNSQYNIYMQFAENLLEK